MKTTKKKVAKKKVARKKTARKNIGDYAGKIGRYSASRHWHDLVPRDVVVAQMAYERNYYVWLMRKTFKYTFREIALHCGISRHVANIRYHTFEGYHRSGRTPMERYLNENPNSDVLKLTRMGKTTINNRLLLDVKKLAIYNPDGERELPPILAFI